MQSCVFIKNCHLLTFKFIFSKNKRDILCIKVYYNSILVISFMIFWQDSRRFNCKEVFKNSSCYKEWENKTKSLNSAHTCGLWQSIFLAKLFVTATYHRFECLWQLNLLNLPYGLCSFYDFRVNIMLHFSVFYDVKNCNFAQSHTEIMPKTFNSIDTWYSSKLHC